MAKARRDAGYVVAEGAVAHGPVLYDTGDIIEPDVAGCMDLDRLVASGAVREATAEDRQAAADRQGAVPTPDVAPAAERVTPEGKSAEPSAASGTSEITEKPSGGSATAIVTK
jgi:hypothetical protein